jgi:hypothetical protein
MKVCRMTKKRDRKYYERRLERDFPAIHSAYRAGKLKSVREAAIKAGLVRKPSRADALKREWKKASLSEKREFLIWIKAGAARPASKAPVVTATGKLTPAVASFLKSWVKSHKATPGQIMRRMGFNNYDYRLASAVNGAALSNKVVPALADWLARNGFK